MDQVKIGNYLKTVRKNKGLTQEELAEKLGVSRRSVSRWETGANLPDIDLMIELADFYDVDLRDMLIIGFLITSRNAEKLREAKLRMLKSLTRK